MLVKNRFNLPLRQRYAYHKTGDIYCSIRPLWSMNLWPHILLNEALWN